MTRSLQVSTALKPVNNLPKLFLKSHLKNGIIKMFPREYIFALPHILIHN